MDRWPGVRSLRECCQKFVPISDLRREAHVRTSRQIREVRLHDQCGNGPAVFGRFEALVPAMIEAESDSEVGVDGALLVKTVSMIRATFFKVSLALARGSSISTAWALCICAVQSTKAVTLTGVSAFNDPDSNPDNRPLPFRGDEWSLAIIVPRSTLDSCLRLSFARGGVSEQSLCAPGWRQPRKPTTHLAYAGRRHEDYETPSTGLSHGCRTAIRTVSLWTLTRQAQAVAIVLPECQP